MKTTLLSTAAAAALMLAAGAATAQNLPSDKGAAPERAPAAQQKAPAEKMAPAMKPSEQKAPGKAQLNDRSNSKSTIGAAPKAEEKSEMKPGEKTEKSQLKGKFMDSDKSKSSATEEKSKTRATDKSNGPAGAKTDSTVSQGSIAGTAKLSTEQRTKISTIFRQHRVAPQKLDISVRVGVRVPDRVHFYPIPVQIVEVYPEWRGYDYIMVGDEILVVDPRTHEIVAILEA